MRGVVLEHDSEGMLEATLGLPNHLEAALTAGVPDLAPGRDLRAVVVLGMGGSGVSGAVLEALARAESPVPVLALGGEGCPSFVADDCLVVAVSFSGETEETLAATATAIDRGATVAAVTGGGALGRLVADAGGTVIEVGRGIPQPRAGIGAMTAPLLLLAERQGLVTGARAGLEEAVEQLQSRVASFGEDGGLAGELARRLGRTIPLAYGAAGLGAVAARRFKTQVNENAKSPAFSGTQPEVCHNEVCGFGQSGDVTRQLLTLVEFRLGDSDRLARRFELFAGLAAEAVSDVVVLEAEGNSPLARFFDLVLIGDVASLLLAAAEDVDPGPVPVIDELKTRIDQHDTSL